MANGSLGLGSFLSGMAGGISAGNVMQNSGKQEVPAAGLKDIGSQGDTGAMGLPVSFKSYGDGAAAAGPAHAQGAVKGTALASSPVQPSTIGDASGNWGTIKALFGGN